MSDVFRTLIVESADVDLARTIAATLDPAHSQGMWETPLSSTGAEPATHYISTGFIGEGFAALVPRWNRSKTCSRIPTSRPKIRGWRWVGWD